MLNDWFVSLKTIDEPIRVEDNCAHQPCETDRQSSQTQLMNQPAASSSPVDLSRRQGVLRVLARTALVLCVLSFSVTTRAQSAPQLVSVNPPNGATNAAPRGWVVFVFDQTMDTTIPLQATIGTIVIGNYEFTPTTVNTTMSGSWGADRRTLTFKPNSAIPLNTTVSWTLNRAGATLPLKSATGQTLATVTGSYKIASNSGGSTNEVCPPVTPAPGVYTFTKNLQYLQSSALDPVVAPGSPGHFAVSVQSPPGGPAVTNGSIVFPSGATTNLALQAGVFRFFESFTTEAALEGARPAGSYTLRFSQTGQPERVISMTMPATPAAIPKIANYAEAQTIDATKDFTLRWNALSPQGAGAVVRLVITDEFANRIFLAPNACVPRTLDPAATSIVIPANYLRPGFYYQGQLLFSLNFYSSTTDVAQMTGNGFVQRITSFSLKTANGTNSLPNELCTPTTPTTGSYTVTKFSEHRQISAEEVVPRSPVPGFFSASLQSPPAGPAVTNGSLTLPDATTKNFTNQFGFITLSGQYDTLAALEGAYPEGNYTLRFNQTGQVERVIAMALPATPAVIPKIANYAEAQAIDATNAFTLRWNAFSPQGPGAFIRLIISDELGNLVFLAPNPCVPRDLDPTATSIVIPANYFRPEVNYTGQLQFGLNFYVSTTDVPQMVGYGAVQQDTSFDLKAASAGGTAVPANFTSYRILSNGHPEFNLSASAGKIYSIQRAGTLTSPTWSILSPVTINASGTAVFEDTDPALTLPAFYRAVGN